MKDRVRDQTKNIIGIKKIYRGDQKNIMASKKIFQMLKISMILRVLLLDTRVLVRRMFESVANTMVLPHYFAKVLRILRFWPDIRVHKGQE